MKLRSFILIILVFSIVQLPFSMLVSSAENTLDFSELLNQTDNWKGSEAFANENGVLSINNPSLVWYRQTLKDETVSLSLKLNSTAQDTWASVQLRANKADLSPWDLSRGYIIRIWSDRISVAKSIDKKQVPLIAVPNISIINDEKWHNFSLSAVNNDNGSVTIKVKLDGKEVVNFVDKASEMTEPGYMNICANTGIAVQASGTKVNNQAIVKNPINEKPNYPLNLLKTLKVVDDTLKLDDEISKAQFLKMVNALMGVDNYYIDSKKNSTYFSDVPASHPLSGHINFASEMGIINGNENNQFSPDSLITYEQTVKILLNILGYREYISFKGGYPSGYLIVANELKLTNGVNLKLGASCKAEEIIKLIYNALFIEVLDKNSIGNDITYVSSKDKTLLTQNFRIKKVQGIVNANSDTTLTGTSNLSKNKIKIDNTIYENADEKYKSYIGYSVIAFAKENDTSDFGEIIYMYPKDENNKVVTVQSNQISRNAGDFSSRRFIYTNNDKDIKLNLSSYADMIYNKKAYPSFGVNELKPELGSVTLIDNNSDNIYEVIIVNSYENYIVDSVSTLNNKVYGKYGKVLDDVDLQSSNENIVMYNNEMKIDDLTKLSEGDVLSVFKSMSKDFLEIQVSTDYIDGSIEEIYDASNGKYLSISGKTYRVASNEIFQYIPDLGMETRFYLDIYGEIAGVNAKFSTTEKYGYLVLASNEKKGINSKPQVKIFTTDNKMKVFNSTDKISVNDMPREDSYSALKNCGKIFNSNGTTKRQIIKYVTNDKGEIVKIYTALDNTSLSIPNREEMFTLDIDGIATNTSYLYRGDGTLANKFFVTGSTIIFEVPSTDNAEDDEYEIKDYKSLKKDTRYMFRIFDLKDSLSVPVMEIQSGGDSFIYSDSLAIVDKLVAGIDANGDNITVLYAYVNGKYQKLIVKNAEKLKDMTDWTQLNNSFSNLKRGDILQCRFDTLGRLIAFKRLYGAGEPIRFEKYLNDSAPFFPIKLYYDSTKSKIIRSIYDISTKRRSDAELAPTGGGLDADVAFAKGTKLNTYSGMLVQGGKVIGKYPTNAIIDTLNIGKDTWWNRNLVFAKTNYYLVDLKNNKVSVVDSNEISLDDEVVSRIWGVELLEIIIYRK